MKSNQIIQLGVPGSQGGFSDKVILDIDGSTEKAVVYWCLNYNVWCLSYKKYVNRWFKINDKSKK